MWVRTYCSRLIKLCYHKLKFDKSYYRHFLPLKDHHKIQTQRKSTNNFFVCPLQTLRWLSITNPVRQRKNLTENIDLCHSRYPKFVEVCILIWRLVFCSTNTIQRWYVLRLTEFIYISVLITHSFVKAWYYLIKSCIRTCYKAYKFDITIIQECIPVGCVPPASVPVSGEEGSVPGPEAEQNRAESHTGVKTLPSRNFVCGR